jgi:hypothetical protein
VKKRTLIPLDFIVDKLTNSIENVVTGDSFATSISLVSNADILKTTKKAGWTFNWRYEFQQTYRDVYKLTIVNNQQIIQGLVCVQVMTDHVYMHLLESAPFNRGNSKMYSGVAGNLVAFVCQLSFQRGHLGHISFVSKTSLIKHYEETLGAIHIGRQVMIIETPAATRLIDKYFKNI